NVKPVSGQQEASPDRLERVVFPNFDAGCRVETVNRSSQVANVQQTVLHDGRSHDAADIARSPDESALSDVSLAIGIDRIKQRRAVAMRRILSHSNKDAAVGKDRCSNDRAARKDAGPWKE